MRTFVENADDLAKQAKDNTSQFGEDGLIAAIFERIGVKNRWCFEVGAADGEFYSNTKTLRDDGWFAVLIEADDAKFGKLKAFQSERVHCVHERIEPASLDRILTQIGTPKSLDLGVIDIDGEDYACFEGLTQFTPRVMVVEFSAGSWRPTEDVPNLHTSYHNQANCAAIRELAIRKGYTPIIANECNLISVLNSEWN